MANINPVLTPTPTLTSTPPVAKPLRVPVFITIDKLRPSTYGHNLKVKVVSSDLVIEKERGGSGPTIRIAEAIVGDETGVIILKLRNGQIDVAKPGETITIRNGKITMFRGFMRLEVDKWGVIRVAEPATFNANTSNNISNVEYELVTVPN
eukprot:TRINITY_DN202_c1_g1_i1.p1 TRINITY_DN202_c1_g1~~TRINITY_DN202_c1_g1_i1.p1  ORF type:complete len:151 (+),score=79.57 TRINITY_DN202_c1_g1_i1:86-538(+)